MVCKCASPGIHFQPAGLTVGLTLIFLFVALSFKTKLVDAPFVTGGGSPAKKSFSDYQQPEASRNPPTRWVFPHLPFCFNRLLQGRVEIPCFLLCLLGVSRVEEISHRSRLGGRTPAEFEKDDGFVCALRPSHLVVPSISTTSARVFLLASKTISFSFLSIFFLTSSPSRALNSV